MRTDLRRACLHCALRLPEACAECPRCRLSTTSPRKAVEALGKLKGAVQVSRPVRDAFIYIPAALLYVAAAGIALYVAGLAIVDLGAEAGGLGVAVSALTLLTVFTGSMIGLAVPWGIWATIVALVAWVTGRKQRTLLRPAPVAAGPLPPAARSDWLEDARHWFRRTRWRLLGLAVALLLAVELVAELLSPRPFGKEGFGGVLSLLCGAILAQGVALVVLVIPLTVVFQAFVGLEKKLRFLLKVWRERARDEELTDSTRGVERLRVDREPARGPARAAATACVAPLSGRSCLGFRLVGRSGLAQIDDADLCSLIVRAGNEDVAVRARAAVVALPDPSEMLRELSPAQRKRVARFLAARDLDLGSDVELGESVLDEGADVAVYGTPGSEPDASTDYRTASTRRVLDDADGRPVLVEV